MSTRRRKQLPVKPYSPKCHLTGEGIPGILFPVNWAGHGDSTDGCVYIARDETVCLFSSDEAAAEFVAALTGWPLMCMSGEGYGEKLAFNVTVAEAQTLVSCLSGTPAPVARTPPEDFETLVTRAREALWPEGRMDVEHNSETLADLARVLAPPDMPSGFVSAPETQPEPESPKGQDAGHAWTVDSADPALRACARTGCTVRFSDGGTSWQRKPGAHWRQVSREPIPPCVGGAHQG